LADLSTEEKDSLYHMIGLGALKYIILKVDPKKTMLFNPKESIDFNGNTGPFIQYTHARICSILRKAEEQGLKACTADEAALSPKEVRLVKIVSAYPAKVAEAAESFSPAVLANYSYDLAKEFNQYYHDTQILREPDAVLLSMRLQLITVVADVLRSAMGLLGIQLPDRM
ncbi:MAG: arginine--tRNA ligase, partial [Bacteroidales bacterium]|nr:arginine--tRNA ligase [Bacteroidales bacterium]